MPVKREKPIPDELLLSNRVWELDATLPLSARQVSLMTDLSVDQLKERRRMRPRKPPLALQADEDDGARRAVWYPLGEVLAYKQTRLARPLASIEPIAGALMTFSEFMANGLPTDEWPFATTREGMPVDFFASLRLGALIDPDGDCGWLTLSEYLAELALWTIDQKVGAERRGMSTAMVAEEGGGASCPKCGRPSGAEHHNCRL